MVNESEDDMQDLLNQLDAIDEQPQEHQDDDLHNPYADIDDSIAVDPNIDEPVNVATFESPPFNLDKNLDVDVDKLPNASELKPSDVRTIESSINSVDPVVIRENDSEPLVDLRKQFEQMDQVTNEMLAGVRADRQEVQDAINLLRSQIDIAIHAKSNPARMYVDNLVKALEVKTNINMTAVKALEAKAKLLAATKVSGPVINNVNSNSVNGKSEGPNQALIEILNNNPLGPEDGF